MFFMAMKNCGVTVPLLLKMESCDKCLLLEKMNFYIFG